MLSSMTGFAHSESSGEFGTLICELRAVNHRYLEISVRLPDELRSLEAGIRERLQAGINRGKLECSLRWRRSGQTAEGPQVNEEFAKQLIAKISEVEHWMHNAARFTVMDLLHWPGVVVEPEQDMTALSTSVMDLVKQTLDELRQARHREGQHIQGLLRSRLEQVQVQVGFVRQRRPQVVQSLQDKLRGRIAELDLDCDPGRLEQELVMQAQRLDVAEELDRLDGHCKEMLRILGTDEPMGRRLDFLMQEFNREANTLSAKSHDLETTQAAVELKVLIEQMREQIQNLE